MSDNELRPIVVGVDGSAAGRAALRWAAEEARRHDSPLDAVSVWHMDYSVMMAPGAAASGLDPAGIEAANRSVLDAATADVHDVDLRRILIEGDVKKLLVEMSRDARMLVVGNRGHNAATELLLGSVSAYCVHHASCPVVVIKAS
ncbi:universal stress protein [Lentzea nigeriaca]|uniref:universal stress protein n=1 Tax=Lentzea nigeriaca TaxID=1128665 RepID=UPI00195803C1|nr:universal stress protein [Lentzea nigeriaca]MBM7864616.1 nucleotide-binding universal stress UspA family protein [Lentzea nigeriaca]